MIQPYSVAAPPPGRAVRLTDIDWPTYSRLLRVFAERPGVRLTYDRGDLEIMAPSMEHEDDGRFLGLVVFVLTEELGLPLKQGGSTTLRRRLKNRGIEPDECFWIANARQMAGRRRLNLRTDPPPYLAIEVDGSHSSMDRLAIYAALGVPGVWRLEDDTLTFLALGPGGTYEGVPVSRTFPTATTAELLSFLQKARNAGDVNTVIREFRDWVRRRRAASGNPPGIP
jgi:Uma2 family endonuclease